MAQAVAEIAGSKGQSPGVPSSSPAADPAANWIPAIRCDVGRLRKAERTPSEGFRVPASVAREGILEYLRSDGSVTRELVLPTEVKRLESLATLRDAVVTVGHPDGGTRMVSPSTYRQDTVGHVSGDAHVESGHVVAMLAIQDGDTAERIDKGELTEISAGYRCMVDPTPGTFDGQRYDAVQRSRIYNHVALLGDGEGRAGDSVALRLDSEDGVDVAVQLPTEEPATKPAEPKTRTDSMDNKERIDGVDYKVGSDEWSQAVRRKCERLDEEIAEMKEEKEKADSDLEKLKADRDALKEQLDGLQAKIDELEDPEKLDEAADERADMFDRARAVLGPDAKLHGKKADEIMREVVAKACPDLKLDDKKAEYIKARFEIHTDEARKKAPTPVEKRRADAFNPAPSKPVASTRRLIPTPLSERYKR